MKITPWTSQFQVEFGYDYNLVQRIKAIPGRRWDARRKSWFIPWESGEALARLYTEKTGKPAPDCIEEIVQSNQEHQRQRIAMSKASSTQAPLNLRGLGGSLRPFQKAGVEYALRTKRLIIGDEMGLGKTVQALATVWSAQAFPLVVVCPASIKLNWQRESIKWMPTASTQVLNGSSKFTRADVYVINYDILGKFLGQLGTRKPGAVILDEMHYIKNHKAKRSQYVDDLCRGVEYVIGLTGTAILNRPAELLHPLKVLGHLDKFGGFWNFAKRYANAYRDRWGWNMDGAANLDELNTKLRTFCYIRREKSEVLTELPAKQKAVVNLPISNRREYNRAVKELVEYLKDESVKDKEFRKSLKGLDKLQRELAINARRAEAGMKARAAEHLVRINALKQLTARGKIDAVKEWVSNFLESGEKLIIFAHHRDIVRELAREFDAPYIDGGVSVTNRQAAVDRFQNDKDCRVIVLNMAAGGVGLTLTAASNVAFVELGWTPALHQQAEDRAHRIGQTKNVTAWYLLAADTIDEDIAALLDRKQRVTDAVNIGGEAVSTSILNTLLDTLKG